ncbi:1D-myo-inositol 2-acetamido-2-deoxy-alpha-D-glucopyranoside deacetylase [Nocardioides dokdonensis FR1436]|uniref:1D-myo-inositol 2-acetamido-2-deoxy-alpha-D-glucopyranoside deacetylase n=1 Tax=Nocardioides dokdonensis FR1436 TaxID=1300347 RepID=A0A1A9GM63_9ACTN|nr:PIG-L deacetylase family protein [Nocardioides dokdonensis]ANH38770.1 1D-myo-inositol 2-acetamido-2-deoxy-alpha-D-glucopyranoside deacetylase [Nocardioides dokdonensis FR1436]
MPEKWQQHPAWGQVPPLDLGTGKARIRRLVVVSAHPDDESLGVGGLITTAHRAGIDVYVVLLTAGEASHPPGREISRQALATERLAEMEAAVALLAPGAPVVFLGAPDGGAAEVEDQMVTALTDIVGDGSHTLLVAPWRHDGHPDHDAAGRAAAEVATLTGARLVEYPLVMWRLRTPEEAPWDEMVRVDLPEDVLDTKLAAIRAHVTQVRALSPEDPPALSGPMLAHFTIPVEHLVVTAVPAGPDGGGLSDEDDLRQTV